MNKIEIESKISKLIKNTDYIGIQLYDNMFPGKYSYFTTRIIGTEKEKWDGKLQEGCIVKLCASIAEAKQGTCGAFIVLYNPVIIEAFRLVPEKIEQSDKTDTADRE